MHTTKSELAGKRIKIKDAANDVGGREILVEDWWDRVAGKSWMQCNGNPACLNYAMRTGFSPTPTPMDNEVVYGKIGLYGFLIHVSELELPEAQASVATDDDSSNSDDTKNIIQ